MFKVVKERAYGSADGTVALTRITELVVSTDGSLIVAQPRDGQIVVLDEAGTIRSRIGRPGRGPGEFLYPYSLALSNGDLFVADRGAGRGNVFSLAGELLHTYPSPKYPYSPPLLPSGPVGLLPDGRLLVQPGYQAEEGSRSPLPLLAFDATGESASEIAKLRFAPRNVKVEVPGTVYLFAPRPVTFGSLWDLSPASDRICILDRPEPTGGVAFFSVTVLSAAGDTLVRRTFRYTPLEVSPSDRRLMASNLASLVLEPVKGMLGVTHDRLSRDFESDLPFPKYFAAADRLLLGNDNRILLRVGNPVQDNRWLILESNGSIAGEARLPLGLELLAAEGDRLWGSTEVEGWPQIVRFRLTR